MRSFEPTELLLVCEEGSGQPAQGFCVPWLVLWLWERSAGVGSSLGSLRISGLMLVSTIMGWLELEETLKPI